MTPSTSRFGPASLNQMQPIGQRLPIHAADPRGVGPVHPVQHRRQRQQSATLVVVLRALGQLAKPAAEKSVRSFDG
jgi:hypothetical protein